MYNLSNQSSRASLMVTLTAPVSSLWWRPSPQWKMHGFIQNTAPFQEVSSLQIIIIWRQFFSLYYHLVNATMVTLKVGRVKKGKEFKEDDKRGLCGSFLTMSQDLMCRNGHLNTLSWNCITIHYNQNKSRINPF